MDKPVFYVGTTVQGVVTVLRPIGWLMAGNHSELEDRFGAAVARGCTRIVVDLSSAQFMDNSSLGVFPALKRRLDDLGGCLVLAAPSGLALRALVAGRLNKYLPVCDTVAEAVELAKQRTESGRWKMVTV